ncbi:GlsB/YeaQ/YmgE family stress response membrane protein [Vagococcus fluvialis]|uniref:GlsB/YeaQ/YmgE family stress response membrane protein n=1 Tax=Vagococcus fluvialis TaxID=2738 RepID=UPI001A8DF4A9|nr:GlsB/YeaQ/YmgE family stress response membrane protein [Vagococcus fluvialis]MBO0488152.1 GlsB/YeaQ/YmgE family stress response membrane protein [Vagococcus fluvialis]
MHAIAVIIVGIIIGAIAGALSSRRFPVGGWIGNLIAGLLGSWIGQSLFGEWGPRLADIAIFPSIIGALLLVIVTSVIMSTGFKRQY